MSHWVVFDGPVFRSNPRPFPVPDDVADADRAGWVRREVRRRAVKHWAPVGSPNVAVVLHTDGRGWVLDGRQVAGRFHIEQVHGRVVSIREIREEGRHGSNAAAAATAATGVAG